MICMAKKQNAMRDGSISMFPAAELTLSGLEPPTYTPSKTKLSILAGRDETRHG